MLSRILFGGAAALAAAAAAPAEPLDLTPYLLDRDHEIALARSAAPVNVTAGAAILTLSADGEYETAEDGDSGFVCLVMRSFSSAFDSEEFFSPDVHAPICFNPEAARTVLPMQRRRVALAHEGLSAAEIRDTLALDLAEGRLTPPEGLALGYMMSAAQYLGAGPGQAFPHVMLYAPYAEYAAVGVEARPGVDPFVFENPGGPWAVTVFPAPAFVTPAIAARDDASGG